MKLLSIVVPFKNEELGIPELVRALAYISQQSKFLQFKTEIIFVDNDSSDNSVKVLKKSLANTRLQYSIYILNRNYGLQNSLVFGMRKSKGDCALVFQSDLQDSPQAAIAMLKEWINGAKVIAGVSTKRSDNWLNIQASRFFYRTIKLASDAPLVGWFQDFYLLDKRVYTELASKIQTNEFIRGRLAEDFGVDAKIYYERQRRTQGQTNFSFAKRYALALDGITKHGTRMIRTYSVFAILFFLTSIAISLILIVLNLFQNRPLIHLFRDVIIFNLLASIQMACGLILEYSIRILRTPSIDERIFVRSKL